MNVYDYVRRIYDISRKMNLYFSTLQKENKSDKIRLKSDINIIKQIISEIEEKFNL